MKRSLGTLAVGAALAVAVALIPAAASGSAALDAPGSRATQPANLSVVAAEPSGSVLSPFSLPIDDNADTARAAVRVGARVGAEGPYGSGTIIGNTADGHVLVLTAEHVTDGIDTRVNLGDRSVSVETIACGPWWADLCILKLDESWPSATAERVVLAPEEAVHLRGVTSGLVSGDVLALGLTMTLDGAEAVPGSEGVRGGLSVVTARSGPGDSGGGVFDSQGRLVGIVIGTLYADSHTLVFSGVLFPSITRELLAKIEAA